MILLCNSHSNLINITLFPYQPPYRCAIPDSFAGMFDMSSVFSCPTLFSMPHFYLGDDRIVASSGGEA